MDYAVDLLFRQTAIAPTKSLVPLVHERSLFEQSIPYYGTYTHVKAEEVLGKENIGSYLLRPNEKNARNSVLSFR